MAYDAEEQNDAVKSGKDRPADGEPTVVEHHHYHYGSDGCRSWGCMFLELLALIVFAVLWMLGHPY